MTGAAAEHAGTRGGPWLVFPVAVALLVAASTPSISQRMPRFLLPVLAALGGGLLALFLARALVRPSFSRTATG